MIVKVGMPEVRRAGRLMLSKTKNQGLKQSVSKAKEIALPSAKALAASYIILINKDQVLAKDSESCDDVDYCSPLFP